MIGAIIMVHGDDQGLVLPPKLAPYQVVIVPIFKTEEEKTGVLDAARKLKAEIVKAGIRVTLDEREGQSPGWKFNDWEMRGVPLRVELGPKDVAKQAAVLARRDRPGREGYSRWCGSVGCEAKIKEETRATMRCIPLEQEGGGGNCVYCGQPATARAIFARAY